MRRRLTILCICTLLACGETPTIPGHNDPLPLPVPELSTVAAAPGAPLEVSGVDLDVLSGEVSLTIGGASAGSRVTGDGRVVALVPLFVADEGTVELPAGPVDVTLYHDGVAIAEAPESFTVLPLIEAPGAVTVVSVALESIVASLRDLSTVAEPGPGMPQGFASATLDALEDLLTADADESLASQIALLESTPDGKALLEGVLASSGLLAQIEVFATQLAALSEATKTFAPPPGLARTTELSDLELARRMQIYVMLRDFGQQVLGETSSEWGSTVGLVGGTVGLVTSVPAVSLISAILSVSSFAINKVALGYLPAQVDSFELIVVDDQLVSGQVAETELWIEASNDPAPITVLDLTDLVLTGMGRLTRGDQETVRGIVGGVATYFLDRMRSLLSAYGQANPELGIDPDVASIPAMSWRAQVTDSRLATPKSFTPDLIDAAASGIIAWRAAMTGEGEGRIYASINTGPDAVVVSVLPGFEYNAGAFGDAVLNTETHSVNVGAQLVVQTSLADEISEGGTNGLEVRAGTLSATGDTVWQAGLSVAVTATGGTVNPGTGATGADGRFDTFVSLTSGSDSVAVDVEVTAASGFTARASDVTRRQQNESLLIFASLPQFMEVADTLPLRIRVGRLTGTGSAEEPFASVGLEVMGGSASPATGTTDEFGGWRSFIRIDSGAEELTVRIVATTASGLTSDTTLTVLNYDQLPIRVVAHDARYWMGAGGTGKTWPTRYYDNSSDRLAPVVGTNMAGFASGVRDAKTCDVRTTVVGVSQVTYDPETGLLESWTSNSTMGAVANAAGLTGTNDPNCYGNAQHQLRLRFRVNEGSWRVSWNGTLSGEDRDAHPNWRSWGYFNDIDGIGVESPPTQSLSGSMVLGAGDYDFFLNPQMVGNTSVIGSLGGFTSTGGHELSVSFERVGGPGGTSGN